MYTVKELKVADGIIKQIALEHQMSEAQMRTYMQEAMNASKDNPDPAIQAQWASFHYSGPEPTPEEFILWAAAMTKGITF